MHIPQKIPEFNIEISDVKSGKTWSPLKSFTKNPLKNKAVLQKRISSLKEISKKAFEELSDDKFEKNYSNFLNFRAELIRVNKAAHIYNNQLHIKFLAFFSKKFKVITVDSEMFVLNRKVFSVQILKNISLLLQTLNKRVSDKKLVTEGIFRIPGNASLVTELVTQIAGEKITKIFLTTSEKNIEKLSNHDLASVIKKIFINWTQDENHPSHELKRIQQTGIGDAENIEDATDAWMKLPLVEKAFCKHCIELMANSYEYSWKTLQPTPPLKNMLVAFPSLTQVFTNAEFLISNYKEIFNED